MVRRTREHQEGRGAYGAIVVHGFGSRPPVVDTPVGVERQDGVIAGRLDDRSQPPLSAILWLEEDRARGEPEKERAVARQHGRAPDVRWHVRKDGTRVFIDGITTPPFHPEGQVPSYLEVGRDMTERPAADQCQKVLVAELQHRTRNLIAVVSSIAQQTMAHTGGPYEAFRTEFNDRLEALSRVQGLLSRSEGEPVNIDGLIRIKLDALGAQDGSSGRVVLDGPPVRLRNSMVQMLALALHELATNAREHLSRDEGRLSVSWQVRETDGEGRRPALKWMETGAKAPVDTSPALRGYGGEVIERALPYSLGAKTSYELRAEGARCTIDLPLEKERRGRRQP